MRYPESERLAQMAAKLVPNGSQTMSKSPQAFPAEFPKMLIAGQDAWVEDADGNYYTDWICGLGANGLGMSHPRVTEAASHQLALGVSYSLPTGIEAEVAERLSDLIPCAEQVRFVKTGSEACAAAVRIARIATGREDILVCGYHGWHDWYIASRPIHPGVPSSLGSLVGTFEYNNLASLADVLDDTVAAIIMEPVLHTAPEYDFLRGVRGLADKVGALLIFDENVTGFRTDLRGAQHHYRVTPDLAVFGKAMANGFPLAAVVGRRDFMEYATPISGTFGGEAVSLAAARATIDVYRDTNCIRPMHQVGYHLLREVRRNLPPAFTVDGMAWKPRISAETRRLHGLVRGLARRGHLIHPGGFYISCAHTMSDASALARACREAAAEDYSDIPEPPAMAWTR